MATRRGEKIIVRAWGDRPLVRVIWDMQDQSVLITNEIAFAALQAGHDGPMPIGFPFSDAFIYEEDKAEKIMGEYASGMPPQWHILRHLTN